MYSNKLSTVQVPGLLLVVYALTYWWFPKFMRFWVPTVVLLAIIGSVGIEVRLAVGYAAGV